MKLPTDLFLWLKGLHLVQADRYNALEDQQELNDRSSNEMLTGVVALQLVGKVSQVKHLPFKVADQSANSMALNTARRIHTWRIAFERLTLLGATFEDELKRLVIAGDEGILLDVFKTLHRRFGDGMKSSELRSMVDRLDLVESRVMSQRQMEMTRRVTDSQFLRSSLPTLNGNLTRGYSFAGGKLPIINDFNATAPSQLAPFDVNDLNKVTNLDHCNSLFEFLVVSLAQTLNMKPKNAVSFFASGGKVMANLVIKGVRRNGHESIKKWYKTMIQKDELILQKIISDDSQSMLRLFMTCLKPGLISKDPEVAQLALDLFLKYGLLFEAKKLMPAAYDWLKSRKGILMVGIFAMKRHRHLQEGILTIFKVYSQDIHFIDLLYTIEDMFENQAQMNMFIHENMYLMYADEVLRGQLEAAKMAENWASRVAAILSAKEREMDRELYFGLCFLVDFWDMKIEEFGGFQGQPPEQLLKNIVGYFLSSGKKKNVMVDKTKQKTTHSKLVVPSKKDKILVISQIFRLLEMFTELLKDQERLAEQEAIDLKKAKTYMSAANLEEPTNQDGEQSEQEDKDAEILTSKKLTPQQLKITTALIQKLLQIFTSSLKRYGSSIFLREYITVNLYTYVKSGLIDFSPFFEDYLKFLLDLIGQNKSLNTFDMQFLIELVSTLDLPIKKILNILQQLVNLFYSSVVTAQFFLMCLRRILSRFKTEPDIIKFCAALSKISLNRFLVLERKRKRPIGTLHGLEVDPDKIKVDRMSREIFGEIVLSQRRALIIELLKEIHYLEIPKVNKTLKNLLIYTNLLYKNWLAEKDLGFKDTPDSPALVACLSLYGDPDQIISKEEIEAEFMVMNQGVSSLDDFGDLDFGDVKQKGDPRNLQFMKNKMSKERLYILAMKRGVKADPRVFKDIADIRSKVIAKKEAKELAEQERSDHLDRQKKRVRGEVVVRLIEHGIAENNIKDSKADLLRPLNSVPVKKDHLQLIRLEEYEDHDRKAVTSIFKKYSKLFRTYFLSYIKNNGGAVVDRDANVNDRISRGNLWIFVKDKGLNKGKVLTSDDISALVRIINLEIMGKKGEINFISWSGFKHFLTQISTLAYPEIGHLPPAFAIERLIAHLADIDKNDKKLQKIFENPEYAGTDDLDLVEFLNKKLEDDPKAVIPDGYEVHSRQILEYQFKVNPQLQIPESYRACYEILDGIVEGALGLRVVEPQPIVRTHRYVKPRVFFGSLLQSKIETNIGSDDDLFTDKAEKRANTIIKKPVYLNEEEKKMMFAPPSVELSTLLKYEVAKYSLRDKTIAKDCAYVLEEVLNGVLEFQDEEDEDSEDSFHLVRNINTKVVNRAMIKRQNVAMKVELQEIQSNAEMKARNQMLKKIIANDKKVKEKKRLEEEKIKEKERKKAEREARRIERRKKRKWKREKKERKRIKMLAKKEKEEQEEKIVADAQRKEKKRQDSYVKFQKSAHGKWRKGWKAIVSRRKQAYKDHQEYQATYMPKLRIKNQDYLKKFKEEFEEKRLSNEEVVQRQEDLKNSDAYKGAFGHYEVGLREVFKYYSMLGKFEVGELGFTEYMGIQEFRLFTTQFSIVPVLYTVDETRAWVNKVLRDVDRTEGRVPGTIYKFPGLTFEQFSQFLGIVFVQQTEFLESYLEDYRDQQEEERERNAEDLYASDADNEEDDQDEILENQQKEMRDSTGKLKKGRERSRVKEDSAGQHDEEGDSDSEDEEKVVMNQFEGLMVYLGILENPKEMKKRLKQVREEFKHEPSMVRVLQARRLMLQNDKEPAQRSLSPIMSGQGSRAQSSKKGAGASSKKTKKKKAKSKRDQEEEQAEASKRSRTRENSASKVDNKSLKGQEKKKSKKKRRQYQQY